MKSLLLVVALMFSASVFAQKHMVEFNAESLLLGNFSFNSTKYRGEKSSEDKFGYLYLNYAYAVASHLQVGAQGYYSKYRTSTDTNENYSLLVGGILNSTSNLKEACYISLYAGMSWDHSYQDDSDNSHGEALISRLSVGKRFPLSAFNLENITYSPEISFTNENSTTSSFQEWQQDLSFKFLQFAVLF